jgi:ABC-type molybdate transport system substrate-binding protein
MHPRLDQAGIVTRAASNPEAARAFRAFMLGEPGRTVLDAYGFTLPPAGPAEGS